MSIENKESTIQNWLAEQYSSTYADGRRCDELGYLQCKLILKPERFTSAHVFKEFASLVHRAAMATGVGCGAGTDWRACRAATRSADRRADLVLTARSRPAPRVDGVAGQAVTAAAVIGAAVAGGLAVVGVADASPRIEKA